MRDEGELRALEHGMVDTVAMEHGPASTASRGSRSVTRRRRAGNGVEYRTRHKKLEERIARLSRIYAVFSGINFLITRIHTRHELFEGACKMAVANGNFGIAWIGVLNPAAMAVKPVAWAGPDSENLDNAPGTARSEGANGLGIVGRAIRENRAVFSNDLAAETSAGGKRRAEILRRGYRSMISLPLVENGAVAGCMVLFAKEIGFFDDGEVSLLKDLAHNISFALENINKEEKLARLSRIQTVTSSINSLILRTRDRQELFYESCHIAVKHGGFGIAWIGSYDSEANRITPVAWSGLGANDFMRKPGADWAVELSRHKRGSVVGRAIRERCAVYDNDITIDADKGGSMRREALARGYRSLIALPLLDQGKVIGNLSIYAKEPGFFNEDEVKLLTRLTDDISFALEHIAKEEQLRYLAYYDNLTNLPNRTLFLDRLAQQLRARSGESRMVALVLLDIERFRIVNDTLGRNGGDELLRLVARRLELECQGKENLARVSANGFGLVIRGARDAGDIAHSIEGHLLKCFREPYMVDGVELRLSAKAGIALFPTDGKDPDRLYRNSEAALKKTKSSGEPYLFYAAEMNARAEQALTMETKLRRAVEAREFVLHYQPKIESATGRICGLEALIRWNDPQKGLVPPGQFIPLLEETGLIVEVGQWALENALQTYCDWQQRGYDAPRIAVNVSLIQLRHKNFVDMVKNILDATPHAGNALDIEITESFIMENMDANIAKLKALRDMGFEIAIDDFGTGYSSLGYLARLPATSLKIDRSFVVAMSKDADSLAIVSTIISLGHSLGMKTIAEGVETEEQSRFLKLLKCDQMQGYLFGKPMPKDQIEAALRRCTMPTQTDKSQPTARFTV